MQLSVDKIKNLVDLLVYRNDRQGNDIAYQFISPEMMPITISYHELNKRAMTIATEIQKVVKEGERVLLVFPPGIDFIYAFFGCLYAKVIAVPAWPPADISLVNKINNIILDCNPSLILSSRDIYKEIRKLRVLKNAYHTPVVSEIVKYSMARKIPLTHWDFDKLKWCLIDNLKVNISEYRKPNINGDYLALLQYTSGSTGEPKGVMVTHENILSNLKVIYEHFVSQSDLKNLDENKILLWLPPYHDMGLVSGIIGPLYSGFPSILMSPFAFLKDPYFWLKAIEKYKATISGGPDFAYEYCCKKITQAQKSDLDLSSWNIAFNGAEPINVHTLRKFYHTFKDNGLKESALHPCYGLAEGTLFVSGMKVADSFKTLAISNRNLRNNQVVILNNGDDIDKKIIVSSGWVNDTVKIRIVNPNTNKLCADDEIGEIWVSGVCNAKGYWNKEELSKEVFYATILNGDDHEKYLKTGDLGFIYESQLYVTGRIKDVIIRRGENYYPQDIEKAAEAADLLLRKGRSVAFYLEDNKSVCIAIETNDDKNIDFEQLATVVRNKIAAECSLYIDIVLFLKKGTLTKTTSGKLQRQETKMKYINGKLNVIYVSGNLSENQDEVQSSNVAKNNNLTQENRKNLEVDDIQAELIGFIANSCHVDVDKLDLKKPLQLLGLDSIQIMELILLVDSKFNYEFNAIEEIKELTIYEIADNIRQSKNKIYQPNKTDIHAYTNEELKLFSNMSEHSRLVALKNTFNQMQAAKIDTHYFEINEGISSNNILINEQKLINYTSSNYLGLSDDIRIHDSIMKAVEKYGSSVSASRLVAGEKPIHQRLEQSIVDLIKAEACVVFNSGYSANISTISYLYDSHDMIVLDELSHNSLFLGAKYSGAKIQFFKHNDVKSLEQILQSYRHQYKRTLIIIEGLYGMDGDIPYLPDYIKLKKKFYTHLMVDEAHSIGTTGKTGRGLSELFNVDLEDIDILMGTLSKSFVSCGGFIAGKADLIQALKYGCPGFVFSVGITPANTAAAYTAIEIMKQEPYRVKKLQDNASFLLSILAENQINTGLSHNSPVIPILTGDTMKALNLSNYLREHKIYAAPIISPAVPKGAERVRLFLNAAHTQEQLSYTAEILLKAKEIILF